MIITENKLTKKGWLGKKVKEVYLRDDISCGFQNCHDHLQMEYLFPYDSFSQQTIYFVDSATLENQTDIIYNCQEITNLIVLQSQAQYLKHHNIQKYNSFKNFVESSNNTNRKIYIFPDLYHKQIRSKQYHQQQPILHRVYQWYSTHLLDNKFNLELIILTSGFNKSIQHQNIKFISLIDFLRDKNSNLLDFLGFNHSGPLFANIHYQQHYDTTLAIQKIKQGILFSGKYMSNKSYLKIGKKIIPMQLINNRALFGDLVAIQLFPANQWVKKINKNLEQQIDLNEQNQNFEVNIETNQLSKQIYQMLQQSNNKLIPKGKVVSIIKRKVKKFCGSVNLEKPIYLNQQEKYGIYQFYPADDKYNNFYIRTYNIEVLKNQRIVVGFDQWPRQSLLPLCHYMRIIGQIGDQRVQGDVILLQHNVEIAQFSKMAYQCLPKQGNEFIIPQSQQKKRLDLRKINVVSIDPPGCKDIDDALHCIQLQNGNFEVGVHIADVSYYVKPDTALDLQARNRSTTVYLVDRRTDMLPKLLTQNLCSLRANVDRLSFSTIWQINKFGQILNTKYCKTIIRSKRAFTYMQAQQLIDSNSQSDIAKGIRNLNILAKKLKQKRIQNGALQLASTQVKITLSQQTHSATDVELYNLVETNSLIQQFMLLSNISVAQKIYQKYPSLSILRRHTQPKLLQLEILKQIMNQYKIQFNFNTSKQLANSLNNINRINDPFFNKLIRILTTRCMNQATYFCSADFDPQEFYHYGLATAFYTHFTSPIRRYADVLVHRLLAAAIDLQPLPNFMINKIKMTKICQNMNMRHRMARYASRASSDYYTYQFFKNHHEIQKGIITSITEKHAVVMLIKYGLESSIIFNQQQQQKTIKLNKEKNIFKRCIIGQKQYQLFNYVNVEVKVELKGFHKKMNIKITD